MNFDELFDDVYPGLYRYCVRLTGEADGAEDAVQEAFVRLLERGVTGRPEGLRAWLFKVATHVVRDHARVRTNRARLMEEHMGDASQQVAPSVDLEREDRIETVRRALATLSERDRTLLLMREEGFAYRELAELTGVEPTSIGTLLARARQRFTQALEGHSPSGRMNEP